MKKNKNIIWIWDGVYNQDILVIFAPNYKDFLKLVKKEICFVPEDTDTPDNACGEFFVISNPHGTLVVIWSSNKTETLLHECFHVCSRILRDRGIELCDATDEAFAYYYTYLIKTIKEKIKEK